MKLSIVLLALLIFSGLRADASGLGGSPSAVGFFDACTENNTAVATNNGVVASLVVAGLTPHSSIRTTTEFFPVSTDLSVIEAFKSTVFSRSQANANGLVRLKRDLKDLGLERAMQAIQRGRAGGVWEIRVKWESESSGEVFGSAQNRIFIPLERDPVFLAIQPTTSGRELCSWREPIQLQSQYYFNATAYEMRISQEVPVQNLQGGAGIDIGATPTLFGKASDEVLLGGTPTTWAFPGANDAFGKSSQFMARIESLLPQNSGGYFVSKTIFRRYPAIRYKFQSAFMGCGTWKKSGIGLADIPMRVDEFAYVPQDVAASTTEAKKFLDLSTPPLEPCLDSRMSNGSPNDEVRTGSRLFFYEP
jgi:hypothetical protein